MADPFRNELESVQARCAELEQRAAALDTENARLRAGFPPNWTRTPPWVVAVLVSGAFVVLFLGFVAFLGVWQYLSPSDRVPAHQVTPASPAGSSSVGF
jgi:type VI protein secretion system component VasF